MYQNKAILMGFLGNDAEVRTGKKNQNFTTFSIATKTSYKDKESGEYVSTTEWHRCIVFGKFGEFAASLKKGAHVQVEGEIRHTEYTPKKAKKPIRTDSIPAFIPNSSIRALRMFRSRERRTMRRYLRTTRQR